VSFYILAMDDGSHVAIVATLLIIGGGLLYAEVFLPGLIAGAIGLICLIVGVALSFSYFGAAAGMFVLILVIVGLVGLAYWWFTKFHTTKFGKKLILEGTIGDTGVGDLYMEFLEQSGVAVTTLRPSGTAKINGRRVGVVTEGQMVEKDTPLKVIAIEGMRVVVRATV
jgi:membrane-bound serine protease (ClpP class)